MSETKPATAPPEMLDQLGMFATLRRACKAAGSQAAFGRSIGVSEQMVSDVLNGKREAPKVMLEAVGLRRIERYQRIPASK